MSTRPYQDRSFRIVVMTYGQPSIPSCHRMKKWGLHAPHMPIPPSAGAFLRRPTTAPTILMDGCCTPIPSEASSSRPPLPDGSTAKCSRGPARKPCPCAPAGRSSPSSTPLFALSAVDFFRPAPCADLPGCGKTRPARSDAGVPKGARVEIFFVKSIPPPDSSSAGSCRRQQSSARRLPPKDTMVVGPASGRKPSTRRRAQYRSAPGSMRRHPGQPSEVDARYPSLIRLEPFWAVRGFVPTLTTMEIAAKEKCLLTTQQGNHERSPISPIWLIRHAEKI